MSWMQVQRTGNLYFNGAKFATGYSGHGLGKNCPELQGAKGLGPIPVGRWKIVGEPFNDDHMGPFVLRLEPREGTDPLGRGGFYIHGDSIMHPGTASRGCPIYPRPVRVAIAESGDNDWTVVAEEPEFNPLEEA